MVRAAAELELRRRQREQERAEALHGGIPPWSAVFDAPSRYKVAYGGRGSGKSWEFARRLLRIGSEKCVRVLCARELQISIRDSVHRLLSDQVHALGLSDHYEIGQKAIVGVNGTEFIFKGLRHNATEIKSTEGVDICWVEEAQAVSEDSWRVLIPTIRSPGSEIWVTFNPDQPTDPTYKRFILNTPETAIIRRVNYGDNPWFPMELEREREHTERTDPDAYANVWLGECRAYSSAQVLAGKWEIGVFDGKGGGWHGPYYGADWGFAKDPSVLVRCWIGGRTLYIDYEAWGVEVPLDDTPALFDKVPDARRYTVRADSARPETIRHLQARGYDRMVPVKKWPGSVEDGVEFLRSFEKIIIHQRCQHTIDEARQWSYKTDRMTGNIMPVLVDAHNHCFDAVRYALSPIIRYRKTALYLPESGAEDTPTQDLPISEVVSMTCSGCVANVDGLCTERNLQVGGNDAACELYLPCES